MAHDTPTSLAAKDTTGILSAGTDETELVSERTRFFKKFAVAPAHAGTSPETYRVGGQVGPIHYRLDPFSETEQYKEIDLTINLTPGENWDAACETNGYQVRFWQNRQIAGRTVRYIAQFRRAGKWLAMAPLLLLWENDRGEKQLISKALPVGAPTIDNDEYRVIWHDVFGAGIDFRYNLRPDEFFKTVVVNRKTDLPAPIIGTQGLKLTLVIGLSWHGSSNPSNGFASDVTLIELPDDSVDIENPDEELVDPEKFSYKDELLRDTWWMRRPIAWDSDEKSTLLDVQWRLRRKVGYMFALLSVPAGALQNPKTVYPVYIDTAIPEEQVGASADDCERAYGTSGGFWLTSIVQVGWYSAAYAQWSSGFRFQTIPIPQGATIDSAKITACSYSNLSTTAVKSKIRAEDVDDAPAFSNQTDWDNRFPSGVTIAEVNWDNIPSWTKDSWYDSPDIKDVVQEVINRSGWAQNNDIVVFWDDYDDRSSHVTNCRRQAYGYDIDSSKAAKFNASYSEGGGVAPLEPWKFAFQWRAR